MTKILIADDNTQNLYLLETILKSRGYEVVSARNGDEAMVLALDHPPDIIVTDILMPEMDGFELCRRWKARELLNEIPFIFYTATYTDLKDEQFALSLGADRFVTKPQQPEVLVQIIEELLAKPRKVRQIPYKKSPGDETKVLQQYNEVLFRKLEKKVLQLENTIAKQKMTENELRVSEQKYRTLITQSPDGVFVVNLKGIFLAVNRVMCENLKYSEEELLSMSIWDIVPEQYIDVHKKRIADILVGKAPNEAAEYMVRGKDGNLYCVEILSAPYYEGEKLIGFQGIARDITERKKAEGDIQQRAALLDAAYDSIIAYDMEGKITYANEAACSLRGYTKEEMLAMSIRELVPPGELPNLDERRKLLAEQGELSSEAVHVRKDGSIFQVDTHLRLIELGGNKLTIAVHRDITKRKKAEDDLRFMNTLLTTQNETSLDGILVVDDQGRMISYNQNFISLWDIPSDIAKSRSDERAIQSIVDKIIDAESFIKSVDYLYEHKEEKSRDEIGLKDGRILDRFSAPMISADRHYYGRVWYFRDITQRKQAEKELIKSYKQTKKTLNDAINTMAKLVEMRDPYTAGHQHRVAELAMAIANEIGCGDDQIEQLRMAAVIHDVGKMYVPSDILSKPGKISDGELNLLRTHAQGGYDVVKGMDFPFAVAQSILQHHERLDGSGYPNSLKDGEICLEAKILAVSDVVEAMGSHRPYRPALGIDKALEEISKNKGRLYDPGIVDACVKLFTEKSFKFTEQQH